MKKGRMIGLTAAGAVLVIAGLVLLKVVNAPEGFLLALPYVLIGVGCGMFGHGIGALAGMRAAQAQPEAARLAEIAQRDERNVAIGSLAKARAYDAMVFVFAALMLSFALMGVNMIAVLLLVAAYLIVIGCNVYWRIRLEREM